MKIEVEITVDCSVNSEKELKERIRKILTTFQEETQRRIEYTIITREDHRDI